MVALVVIVFEVATYTFHVHFIRKRILGVTIIASQLSMATKQCEVSIMCVIETRVGPVNRVVTILALLSAAAFVCIVLRVAAEAGFRRVLEDLSHMTIDACGTRVIAHQRIVC